MPSPPQLPLVTSFQVAGTMSAAITIQQFPVGSWLKLRCLLSILWAKMAKVSWVLTGRCGFFPRNHDFRTVQWSRQLMWGRLKSDSGWSWNSAKRWTKGRSSQSILLPLEDPVCDSMLFIWKLFRIWISETEFVLRWHSLSGSSPAKCSACKRLAAALRQRFGLCRTYQDIKKEVSVWCFCFDELISTYTVQYIYIYSIYYIHILTINTVFWFYQDDYRQPWFEKKDIDATGALQRKERPPIVCGCHVQLGSYVAILRASG